MLAARLQHAAPNDSLRGSTGVDRAVVLARDRLIGPYPNHPTAQSHLLMSWRDAVASLEGGKPEERSPS